MKFKNTVAIVPGSFDPITNGHLFVIREAAKLYDKVFVAVMINANKQYTFTLEERTKIAKATTLDIPQVEVISSSGWLYELAKLLDADAIVKGYRNDIDLKYEQEMAEFNKAHAPNIDTVLIKASEGLSLVSSTIVREKMKNNEDISDLLPKEALDVIYDILSNK